MWNAQWVQKLRIGFQVGKVTRNFVKVSWTLEMQIPIENETGANKWLIFFRNWFNNSRVYLLVVYALNLVRYWGWINVFISGIHWKSGRLDPFTRLSRVVLGWVGVREVSINPSWGTVHQSYTGSCLPKTWGIMMLQYSTI